MKKALFVMVTIFFACICFLSACGTSVKSEADIKQDVVNQNYDLDYYHLNNPVVNITKRQTNKDQKNDRVWCTLSASNEDIDYWAEYELLYVLYNDGWQLENGYQTISDYNVHSEPAQQLADALAESEAYGELEFLNSTKDSPSKYYFEYTELEVASNDYLYTVNKLIVTCKFDPHDGWAATGFERTREEVHVKADAIVGRWQGQVQINAWFGYDYTCDLEVLSINDEKITYRMGLSKGDTTGTFQVDNKIRERDLKIVWLSDNGWDYYGFETTKTVAESGAGYYYLHIIAPKSEKESSKIAGIYFGNSAKDLLRKINYFR